MTVVPSSADWFDTDEHRDQAWNIHQRITQQDGPYIAAAWLVGISPHPIRGGHSADARAAAYAQINA
ncbi:hypothetical protein [Streptomyces tubercidicus]|uniref:hypothetical protein n=1 Tax=Streptomyces tubercidicus TaxID=47759 RepID=UPI0034662F6A